MAKKIETAADRYARIKAERAATAKIFDVITPSGMEWKLRRPNIHQFLINGTLPLEFAAKVQAAMQKASGDEASAMQSLDWKDQVRGHEFNNFIVRYCAVSPRIVEHPEGPDEVGFDIELDDYNFILAWATGGDEAASLNTFSNK